MRRGIIDDKEIRYRKLKSRKVKSEVSKDII